MENIVTSRKRKRKDRLRLRKERSKRKSHTRLEHLFRNFNKGDILDSRRYRKPVWRAVDWMITNGYVDDQPRHVVMSDDDIYTWLLDDESREVVSSNEDKRALDYKLRDAASSSDEESCDDIAESSNYVWLEYVRRGIRLLAKSHKRLCAYEEEEKEKMDASLLSVCYPLDRIHISCGTLQRHYSWPLFGPDSLLRSLSTLPLSRVS